MTGYYFCGNMRLLKHAKTQNLLNWVKEVIDANVFIQQLIDINVFLFKVTIKGTMLCVCVCVCEKTDIKRLPKPPCTFLQLPYM